MPQELTDAISPRINSAYMVLFPLPMITDIHLALHQDVMGAQKAVLGMRQPFASRIVIYYCNKSNKNTSEKRATVSIIPITMK